MSQTAPSLAEQEQAAMALEQQGNLTQAEVAWREVLKLHPSDAGAYAHLGLLAARRQHYADAIAFYRKALAIRPAMPEVRLDLGLAQFKSGDLKAAAQTFGPLLKSAPPQSPQAMRLNALVGMAYYGLGQFTTAIPYLKKAAADDPANVGFRMTLAQCCLAAHQAPCVLDVYKELLNLNAGSAEAEMLVGEALDEIQNHAAAIEHFRAAVKADPRAPNAHFGLGYLLWTQNRFDEAAAEFRAELAIVPEHAQALTYLADCDIHLGKTAEALPAAEKAVQLDPAIAKAHVDLGILYSGEGRREDAVREFKAAIKLAPDDQDPHWRLARLYQSMGRKEDARAEFEATRKLHKAEDQSLIRRLQPAQGSPQPAQAPAQPLPGAETPSH
ncbi:MAG: tetratricopeptide repeat protein [Acidobacteriota bacterium]